MGLQDMLICLKRGKLLDIMNYGLSRIHYDFFVGGGISGYDERYQSQFGQDFFLDRYIFEKKENGVFIDIGANHPVKLNNSFFFEKTRHWSGLAFEPQNIMNCLWTSDVRSTECLPYALGILKVKWNSLKWMHMFCQVYRKRLRVSLKQISRGQPRNKRHNNQTILIGGFEN